MLSEILPGHEFTGIQDAPALFTMYGQPLSRKSAGPDGPRRPVSRRGPVLRVATRPAGERAR